MPDLPVAELRALLQGQCPGLLFELVPGLRREGAVYTGPNPRRGGPAGKTPSFKVWPKGIWREYDEPEETGKGDILGLIAYVAGLAPKSREGRRHAITWAKHRLGLDTASPAKLAETRRKLSHEAQAHKAREEAVASAAARRRYTRALDIWQQAASDPAAIARYMRARGIELFAIPHRAPTLRLHPALDHWAMPHGRAWRGPAMVASMIDPSGHLTGIHCTWLRDDFAGKAEAMPNAKLMLGTMQGSIVPLTYGESGLTVRLALEAGLVETVILCEGIETGLAVAAAVPEARVWACLNLGNIAHAPVGLACIGRVVVALENDLKPQALKQRETVMDALEASGKPIGTMRPHLGNDFADVMKG